jgi:hypothetical protein
MRPVIRLAGDPDIEAIASLAAHYWDFENIPGFDRARTVTLLAEFMAHSERGHCWDGTRRNWPSSIAGRHQQHERQTLL